MRRVILSLLFLALLLPAVQALAATRYVSDELVIMLRRGKGDEYKITKMLKANTPMEVLQEEEEWLYVRVQDGSEGWVMKQFTTTDTPKPMIIARLEKERDRLKGQLQELESSRSELKTELESVRQDRISGDAVATSLQRELQEVQGRFEDLQQKSARVVEISDERDRLESQNAQLSSEVERLRQENEEMLFTGAIKWFMAGGGVFLAGWIIGKMSRRKKKGYSY